MIMTSFNYISPTIGIVCGQEGMSENHVSLRYLRPGKGWPGPIYRRFDGQTWTLLTTGEHTRVDDSGYMNGGSERVNPDELVELISVGNGRVRRSLWRLLVNGLTYAHV